MMLRVAWWLLVALAANEAWWFAWGALGVPPPGSLLYSLLDYGIWLGVVAFMARHHLEDASIEALPARGMSAKLIAPLVLLALAKQVIAFQSVGFCEAINVLNLPAPDGDGYMDYSSPLSLLLGGAVMPAVFEEITMRGIVLTALASMMSVRRAIVISAFFFAALHFQIERMADTFLAGIVYGWIFVRTRSLLPTMLAHFLHNVAAVLLLLTWSGSSMAGIQLDAYGLLPWWVAWAGALLFALALIGIKMVPAPRPPATATT